MKTTAAPTAPSTGRTALSSSAKGKESQGNVFWGLGTAASTTAVHMAKSTPAMTSRPLVGGGKVSVLNVAFMSTAALTKDKTHAHPRAPKAPFPDLSRDHLRELWVQSRAHAGGGCTMEPRELNYVHVQRGTFLNMVGTCGSVRPIYILRVLCGILVVAFASVKNFPKRPR